jgi:hypothetical protein
MQSTPLVINLAPVGGCVSTCGILGHQRPTTPPETQQTTKMSSIVLFCLPLRFIFGRHTTLLVELYILYLSLLSYDPL